MNNTSHSILPFAVSAPRRRPELLSRKSSSSPNLSPLLFQRARTTNLAVAIIAGVAVISVLINLRLWLGDDVFRSRKGPVSIPLSIRATLQSPHSTLRHLVMVPGHAIWTGCDASEATMDLDWILEPIQRGGSVKTFIRHVTKGAEVAVQDASALLVYSGGQTRARTDISEATSYARLAKAGNIYAQFTSSDPTAATSGTGVDFERVTTEEYALDSYSNLLFSIARFKEFTGHYPTFITVVGFGMKQRRYEDVHRAALRWPASAFRYIGIDNENETDVDYDGERVGGLEPYVKDSYGCKGALLAKRRKRNPYRRMHPYHTSAPELDALFEYCPRNNEIFPGKVPWD